ncbi:MAG: hypothetical protein IPP33_14020 [Flavobacteriales bacterium]|nr:hypothetical protein [Flavobacteriales bacterium]
MSDGHTLRVSGNRHSGDVLNWDNAAPIKGDLILLRNAGYNISYRTTNPLRYQVSVKRSGAEPDQYEKTIASLQQDISTIVTAVSGGVLPKSPEAGSEPQEVPVGKSYADQFDLTYTNFQSTAGLSNDAVQIQIEKLLDGQLRLNLLLLERTSSTGQRSAIGTSIKLLAVTSSEVESFANQEVTGVALDVLKRLFRIDFTNSHSEDEIKQVQSSIDSISRMNTRFSSKIDSLKKWKASANTDAGAIALLQSVREPFKVKMEALLTARQSVQERLQWLKDELWRTKGEVDGSKNGVQLIHSSILPIDSTVRMKLTVKERWIELDKSLKMIAKDTVYCQRELRFMKTHTFYPQIFPAITFSNISFPQYDLVQDSLGQNVIAYFGELDRPLTIAGMVNFNLKMKTLKEVPFMQLGVSYKKNTPLLFWGLGIRITENFGISGGAMFAWKPGLNTLKVGDVVQDKNSLDRDLTYQFQRPTFYLGIQIRPSSLTEKK